MPVVGEKGRRSRQAPCSGNRTRNLGCQSRGILEGRKRPVEHCLVALAESNGISEGREEDTEIQEEEHVQCGSARTDG